ncbi:MAG: hypothetical protein U9N52_09250 [Campylobacterota bacterium]|nr:hypothetical protein [Campylobacterota bacterium]
MIFFSNSVIVYLFIEALILLLLSLAFINVISILKSWNFNATSSLQYHLEKRAYLVLLIIFFTLGFKIVLLPYFTYMIDGLSLLVPGAMCAAGVINSNEYGVWLLSLKVIILFLVGIWIVLNHYDLKAINYPYFKRKLWLFLGLFILIIGETILDILYLNNIETQSVVSCCSSIYGTSGIANPIPFDLHVRELLALFYLLYGLSVVSALYRYALLSLLTNVAFLTTAYYSVVYFFGTYIYELPTHLCPFCMLQAEYFYVGYFIWGTLFLGTFFGMAVAVIKYLTQTELVKMYRASLLFNTIFILLCSSYVLLYYIRNGVFL